MEGDVSLLYLTPTPGARWAIRRWVQGKWIGMIQDSSLFDHSDAVSILTAIDISPTPANLDQYFPERQGKGRCPTLELMELCNVFDPTNPKGGRSRSGV